MSQHFYMIQKIDKVEEKLVRSLKTKWFTRKEIQNHLEEVGVSMSVRTISMMVHNIRKARKLETIGKKFVPKYKKIIRTKKSINKVEKKVKKDNPKNRSEFAEGLKI